MNATAYDVVHYTPLQRNKRVYFSSSIHGIDNLHNQNK
jgi:hypothetical protein